TAVKIAPCYRGLTLHVRDASRAVTAVAEILHPDRGCAFAAAERTRQAGIRESHASGVSRPWVALTDARAERLAIEWRAADVAEPPFTGHRLLDEISLADVVPYIDWTPFFHVWELRGVYPSILDKPDVGDAAREVLHDGRRLLDEIVAGGDLRAKAVYGFYWAQSDGDDIVLYADADRRVERCRFHMLRQQRRAGTAPFLSLADFVAPNGAGGDTIGAFAVTAGLGVDEMVARFERDQDDYHAIMVKAIADRLAEALAELMHERARRECGIESGEATSKEDLFAETYRGIRPAVGYPACPDHTEKGTLFSLLDAEAGLGVRLTESFAMTPTASVCGLYFNHPDARYFSVGKIGRDQVEDYATRKGWSVAETERWLQANLDYLPNSRGNEPTG
ncbi:MAG: vitamin B12 dependent-methionine synthase activation domain-containing protein, partial [Myxococcota bacterium]